jgi:hypothetical protein
MKLRTADLLLAAWLGAALITVAVVAPGAFAVLPNRAMAGTMVGRVLPSLFVGGIVVGAAVVALAGLLPGAPRRASIAAIVLAGACAVAQFVFTPRLDRLREQMTGGVDALPPEDARRVAFGLLHGYTVAGLGVAMLGAVACLGFLHFAARPRT